MRIGTNLPTNRIYQGRVLVVARQAGSASALAPVIDLLRRELRTEVQVFGFKYAFETFQRLKCESTFVEDLFPILEFVKSCPIDGLLSGTSLCAEEDGALWALAKELRIPSVALLDHWCNYWERFTRPSGTPKFEMVPDRIAVMDHVALRAMKDAGCPEEFLVVTGQPAFDALTERSWPVDVEVRQRLGLDSNSKVILFVSEPQAEYFGSDCGSPDYLGFTEDQVLEMLLQTLEGLGLAHSPQILVKPHPIETGNQLRPVILRHSSLPVKMTAPEAEPRFLVVAADVVVGMTSVLLFEAALMGRPTASLRPNNRMQCDLVEQHPALITDIRDRSHLARWLTNVLTNSLQPPHSSMVVSQAKGAGRRVVSLLLDMWSDNPVYESAPDLANGLTYTR